MARAAKDIIFYAGQVCKGPIEMEMKGVDPRGRMLDSFTLEEARSFLIDSHCVMKSAIEDARTNLSQYIDSDPIWAKVHGITYSRMIKGVRRGLL
tara:strand:+ start:199 stop:483 length:285 start_codon:yes stop_codon:yes gene_type:complete